VPDERPFLTARWRHLAMLNYEVDRALLAPLVPRGTELDDFDGALLASIVGFRFLDTRVLGVAIPGHSDFDEVNLRFYVRGRGPDGAWRRAVVFVKEIVPRAAVALVARWCYNEPYLALPMGHTLELDAAKPDAPGAAEYRGRLGGRWQRIRVEAAGAPCLPAPGSEAEFVTEHYWGYTAQRDGGCKEYRVHHPRWRVWNAARAALDADLAPLYGAAFASALAGAPRSALLAEGSEVAVYRGTRLAVPDGGRGGAQAGATD
jgi:uncharacterized protein YqjF (DUF2071 family)